MLLNCKKNASGERYGKKGWLPAVFILFFSLLFSTNAKAQSVDLSVKDARVQDVLTQISRQTGVSIIYSDSYFVDVPPVTMEIHGGELMEVIRKMLGETKFTITFEDNIITIKPKAEPAVPQMIPASSIVIRGMVTGDGGEPLPGASVVETKSGRGVVTNDDGIYNILIPTREGAVLRAQFMGFNHKDIPVGAEKVINFSLEMKDNDLSEVVVTGIFDFKSETFTGAAQSYSKEDLKSVGNVNVLQSLQNLDPSFVMTENLSMGSDPNFMGDINIRGQSGFPDLNNEYGSNPNQPLFILDGFEASMTNINDLDMERVESITILKDAAAKAIYGSKAANGVVVIETRKPEPGKLRLTYNGTASIEMPDLDSYNLTNAAEKLQVERDAGLYNYSFNSILGQVGNANRQYPLSNEYYSKLDEVYRGVDTDWLSKPLRNGVGQRHTLYLEGGSEQFQYGIDFAYNDVAGVMKESNRRTVSGGMTFIYRFNDLLIRNQLLVANNKGNNSPWGQFGDYAQMNPYLRPYDEIGNMNQSWQFERIRFVNPMWNSHVNTKDFTEYTQLTNNLYFEWTGIEGLKTTVRVGLMHTDDGAEIYHPTTHTDFVTYTTEELLPRRGSYFYQDGKSDRITVDAIGSYSKIKGDHFFIANLGWNLNSESQERMSVMAEGFPNDRLDNIGFASQYAENTTPDSFESSTNDVSFVSAVNYAYKDRYLFDLSGRLNGSSQFGSDNRWGKFWSVGAGWNLHKENFLSMSSFVNLLKIRGSLGFTGSQNFNSYQSKATYTYETAYYYNGQSGAYLLGLPNNNLAWQRKKDLNLGVDFTIFKNRLNGRFDYYNSNTDDLLTDVTLPYSTGFNTYKENLGKVQNQGVEVYLNYRLLQNPAKKAYLNAFVSFTHNKNKIKEISNSLASFNDESDAAFNDDPNSEVETRPITRYEEGQSMNAIWAVQSNGIDPATGDEIFVRRDGTTTFEWSADDQVVAGNTDPKLQGIAGISGGYAGFRLNVTVNYSLGGDLYNQTVVDKVENADPNYNVDRRVFSDRWVNPGDVVRFKNISDRSTTLPTSRFVEKNNYLTISTINLDYDLNQIKSIKAWGIQQLLLSFYMNDIARFSSIDIERGTAYPYAKSFSVALRATF